MMNASTSTTIALALTDESRPFSDIILCPQRLQIRKMTQILQLLSMAP
jgi:hypothetical protein